MSMHEGQIDITDETGRRLITEQFPRWAREPVRRVHSTGTVNAIFRIGEEFAARFPLLGDAAASMTKALEREAAASAEFARHSPFPSPLPVGLGLPCHGYHLPWSVQTWLRGSVATDGAGDSNAFASDLAVLVATLRGVDTGGRGFTGDNRGGHLPDHDDWVEECLRKSEHLYYVGTNPAMSSMGRLTLARIVDATPL